MYTLLMLDRNSNVLKKGQRVLVGSGIAPNYWGAWVRRVSYRGGMVEPMVLVDNGDETGGNSTHKAWLHSREVQVMS